MKKFSGVVETFKNPMLVTFTTKNFTKKDAHESGLRAVRRGFTRLKKNQRWWKRCVVGGVAGFEMTKKKKGFHPHVHMVIDCAWLAVTVTRPPVGSLARVYKARGKMGLEEVAAQWTLAIGRPGSVHVRRIGRHFGGSLESGMHEVLKYSVTAESLSKMDGDVTAYLDELDLTRTLVGFGSAYRHPALRKQIREQRPCECCSAFGTMMLADIVDARRKCGG